MKDPKAGVEGLSDVPGEAALADVPAASALAETGAAAAHAAGIDRLGVVEDRLGYRFTDRALLRRALTHASSTAAKYADNERLEFLGDAVLDMVICEALFLREPALSEGEMTEIKSGVVRRRSLAAAAQSIGLKEFLILGRGIAGRERLPASIFANVFEAIVAAIYLDGGYGVTRDFILRNLGALLDETRHGGAGANYKSILQQRIQKEYNEVPSYRVVRESGPDHAKHFEVVVHLQGDELGRGAGSSKKVAEQAAAHAALEVINEE